MIGQVVDVVTTIDYWVHVGCLFYTWVRTTPHVDWPRQRPPGGRPVPGEAES